MINSDTTIFGEETSLPSVPSKEYDDAVKLTVMKMEEYQEQMDVSVMSYSGKTKMVMLFMKSFKHSLQTNTIYLMKLLLI